MRRVVAQPLDPPSRGLRSTPVADAVRGERLIVVLRRVTPRKRLVDLVCELADAGARVFEITFDAPEAADDLAACARALAEQGAREAFVGAGTLRSVDQVEAAIRAGAAFGVSPVLDGVVLQRALGGHLPFVPGAFTPTEADAAWRSGATFVKLFPASALGPSFVRELRGPAPEIEVIATGGVDGTNVGAFLEAGAAAVGIGSALVRADASERRRLVALTRRTG